MSSHQILSERYSALYPTQREETQRSQIDRNRETLVFDIDGTIADIEHRLNLAPGTRSDGTRTHGEWNVVLSGSNYKHDRVIPVAWAYLRYIESLDKYNIVYLSGRRSSTVKASMKWLFKHNQYPKGLIIHRAKGMKGQEFKYQQLLKLNDKLNIAGYFGDRIVDDAMTAVKAGVRPILVVPNEWLFAKHIHGGVGTVIESVIQENEALLQQAKESGVLHGVPNLQNKQVPDIFVDVIRKSEYWDMPYNDLVPMEFATELFDDSNMELLPPNVIAKIQDDEHEYWPQIMQESHQIRLLHGSEDVKKFIEDSESDLAIEEGSLIEDDVIEERSESDDQDTVKQSQLEALSWKELRGLCKMKGLFVSGTKPTLVTRLLDPHNPANIKVKRVLRARVH